MPLDRALKLILTALLLASGLWLGTSRQFYREALAGAFFAFALAGVIVIHLRVCPRWMDAGLLFAGAIFFGIVDFQVLHYHQGVMGWLSFAGMSSILVFGIRTIWASQADRKLRVMGYVPALLFVVSEYFADNLLHWTAAHHTKVLDLYLYSFDSSLGIQFPFVMGQAFASSQWLRLIGILFYVGLPIPIALIYSGQLLRVREKAIPAMVAFLATGPIGVIFYNLFPALGPIHLFGQAFPWHPFTSAQASQLLVEPVALDGPPNAIPSLHMAWMLLVWWYSRGLSRWERSLAMLFLFFTILATLGTGEHYFVDLIVAFPFALLMQSACAFSAKITDRNRGIVFLAGLAGTLGWFALLRHALHFFWATPVLPWTFCVSTIVASLYCERLLQRNKGAAVAEKSLASPALSPIS